MSNLLKIITEYKKHLNFINYTNFKINVIIICLAVFLFSCEASEKAEKARLEKAHKTVDMIPPSQEDSEFFKTSYEKQPTPVYPWESQ